MTAGLHRALLFLYAETPVHAGADAGLGALDLPIQREVATKLPIIKGESLKGALREHLRPMMTDAAWQKLFGASPPRSGIPAGALLPGELRVHEAQMVAFPAPSLDGFAWVTSPLARARLRRRAALAGIISPLGVGGASADDGASAPEDPDAAAAGAEEDDTQCLMTNTSSRGSKKRRTASVVLGSYAFTAVGDGGLKAWAAALAQAALPGLPEHSFFRDKLQRDIYQVSDVALTAITGECTMVAARVQLGAPDDQGNPTKTVQHGPFYSEYLPTETMLAAMLEVPTAEHLTAFAERISGKVIQVGADETIGKGLMWCQVVQPGTTAAEADPAMSSGTQK